MSLFDFSSLIGLYKKMDAAYDQVAVRYDFHCAGCTDNCCRSLFFHHTFIEKAFLTHGFSQMEKAVQSEIRRRAAEYISRTFADGGTHQSLKLMCPLNRRGRCTLYFFRPMICRLHGLPHELHPPGRQAVTGPGCDAGNFSAKPYIAFDRTPFYIQMRSLEQNFRQQSGKTGRLRQTIARMLISPASF